MSAKPLDTDADEPRDKHDARFTAACEVAREAVRFERVDELTLESVGFATESVPENTLAYDLAFAFQDLSLKVKTALNQPEADEVDGAAPGDADTSQDDAAPPVARTFLFDGYLDTDEADEAELAFEVAGTFENSYGDERVIVETPAPWDVPDDHEGDAPNDVIKSLPWGDDEAAEFDGLDAGVHYTFSDDDRRAPPEAAKAWSLDKHGAVALKDLAEANGYEWNGRGSQDDDADEGEQADRLNHSTAALSKGDRVAVRYAKANGNGSNVNAGEVLAVYGNRFRFETDDGKTRFVSRDEQGDAALYHGGQYPFMGTVEAVSVEPQN